MSHEVYSHPINLFLVVRYPLQNLLKVIQCLEFKKELKPGPSLVDSADQT